MKLYEYAQYDAVGLANLVRSGEISPVELLDTAVAAIEQVNPKLNAVVDYTYDYARRQIDAGIDFTAPFCGVPMALKDCGGVSADIRATMGTRLSGSGVYAESDSTLLKRFKAAGTLIVATSATSEFCNDSSTETLLHGPTRNPWNEDCSPGGSSGGAAALVGSGALPISHGSDGGGSIRIPASMCGIVGFKASRFRVPVGPRGWDPGVGGHFILSRSVRDAAAMLDAVEGADIGYYGNFVKDEVPHAEAIKLPMRKLRVAYMLRTPYGREFYDAECAKAVLETVDLLKQLGHECVEAYPELTKDYQQARIDGLFDNIALEIESLSNKTGLPINETTLEPLVYKAYLESKRRSGLDVCKVRTEMAKAGRAVGRFFENFDVVISPTTGRIERRLGTLNGVVNPEISATEWAWRRQDYACLAPMANVAGLPSISVPLYISKSGMPLGIMIDGSIDCDQTVLCLAAQLEAAKPWRNMKPDIYVK